MLIIDNDMYRAVKGIWENHLSTIKNKRKLSLEQAKMIKDVIDIMGNDYVMHTIKDANPKWYCEVKNER